MSKSLLITSFIRSSGVAFVLKAIGAALAVVIHVLMGRLLGAEEYGVFSIGLALSAFGSLFAVFGFDNAAIRFVSQYLEQKAIATLKGFVHAACIQSMLGSLAIIIFCIGMLYSGVLPGSRVVLILMMVLLVSYVFIPLYSKLIRGFGDIAGSLWPEQLLFPTVTLAIFASLTQARFYDVVAAFVVGRYTTVIVSYIILRRHTAETIPKNLESKTNYIAWYGTAAPLFVAALINILYLKADTLMVGAMVSFEQAGLYTAASRVSMLLSFVLGVIGTAVAPMLSASFHGGRMADFRKLFWLSILLSGIAASLLLFLVVLFSSEILSLYGTDFLQANVMLVVLSVGQFVNAVTGPVAFALMVSGNESIYARVMLIGGCLNLALNALLIPQYAGVGAAYATAISLGGANLVMLLFLGSRVLFQVDARLIKIDS